MHHGLNPFDQLEKRPTAGPGREVTITEDEARRLLAKLKGVTYYKVALALATGLRWGEIHCLAWEDVDLDAGRTTIQIRRSWRSDPKTETSAATIAISDDAAATLRQWKARQGEARYVFPDRAGQIRKKPYRREETMILAAAKEVGIVSRVTPARLSGTRSLPGPMSG